MDKKFILKVILISTFSFYVVLIQLRQNKKNSDAAKNLKNETITSTVNKNLKTVYKVNELNSQKNKNEIGSEGVDLSDEELGQLEEDDELRKYGVDFKSKDQFKEIYKDFERNEGDGKMNLEDMISKRITDRKWLEDYQRNKNKAYIREFIENARANGYEIVVDEDNEVKSVRPIRPKGYSAPF